MATSIPLITERWEELPNGRYCIRYLQPSEDTEIPALDGICPTNVKIITPRGIRREAELKDIEVSGAEFKLISEQVQSPYETGMF